jgi:drug/metabolite transporter (DMT)-like permease
LHSQGHLRAYLALLSVYFFWGTTYLGIRMALESFGPMHLISLRFLLSGVIMLAVVKIMKVHLPQGRELWRTAFYGIIVLGGGTGCLILAEQWIPSGLAALFVTTGPFWMVAIESLLPGGQRLHLPTLGGIVLGFLGVILLLSPQGSATGFSSDVIRGFFTLQIGGILWGLGAILQRREPTKAHPVVSGAVQQLATGIAFIIPALLIPSHPIRWSTRGVMALLYLVTFGSIVGYSAFIYAMEKLPVAIVSTYTYVNPLVAIWLGWIFYREPFGWRTALAMVVIFTGVAVVKLTAARATPSRAPSRPVPRQAQGAGSA